MAEPSTLPVRDAPLRGWSLLCVAGRRRGARFPIYPTTWIGRALQADVRLQGAAISRFHARIVQTPSGGFTIEDLGSRFGVKVGWRRVREPRTLRRGDKIRIANTVLALVYDG
ncbi:MAG: FHA domain-containing protein [Myxococcota bacterium]